MKKINWKLRFQNKTTLVTLITLVLTFVYQILAMCEVVPKVSQDAVMELFMILINILVVVGVVVDPTTEGVGDSEQALTYSKPKEFEPYKNENEDELQASIKMMNSADYKQRFKAEYIQLKVRKEKLSNLISKYNEGELDFEPDCPIEMLKKQLQQMSEYLCTLELRAKVENIDLNELGDESDE